MSEEEKIERLRVLDGQIRARIQMEILEAEERGSLFAVMAGPSPELKELLEEYKVLNVEIFLPPRPVIPTSQNDLNKN